MTLKVILLLGVGGQPVIFLTSLKFEIQKFFTGKYFCCHLYLFRGSQRQVYVSFCLESEWLGYTTVNKVQSFYGFGRMSMSLLAFVHLQCLFLGNLVCLLFSSYLFICIL
jgi:hypothetical protein